MHFYRLAPLPVAAEPRLPLPFGSGQSLPLPLTGPLGPTRGLRGSHIVSARTGMACVLRWSFSVVGAGSSERAWPRLVCWLLILITAGSSEPGAPSPGVAAGFAFARISHWPASAGPRAEGSRTEAPGHVYLRPTLLLLRLAAVCFTIGSSGGMQLLVNPRVQGYSVDCSVVQL